MPQPSATLRRVSGGDDTMDVITDLAESEWRTFLEEAPSASIFQSPAMSRVYRQTQGYRPEVVAAVEGGSVRTLVASAMVSYSRGRAKRLSSRSIIVGGPVGDSRAFADLLAAHDARSLNSVLLTQIRNPESPVDRKPFERIGYRWEDHLNYLIDLRAGTEAVLEGMSEGRRKSIEKAERSGLEMRVLATSDLRGAYNILRETYVRAHVPLAHESLFRSGMEVLQPTGNLWAFAAIHNGTQCAVRFVLPWRTTIYDWYAGSSEEGRHHHADEWLVWQILRKGIDEGFHIFDFQGAGRPGENYGPGEFKRRFGGQQTNPGRFEKVYRPLAMKAFRVGHHVWKWLRR